MTQAVFGAGILWGIPLQDVLGAAITNPTPIRVGIMQEINPDFSFDTKELYGQFQFPQFIGRGKGKMTFKAKFAQFNGLMLNSLYFGMPAANLTSGTQTRDFLDGTGTAVPTTPFQITIVPPGSGTFTVDLGVRNGTTGLPLTRVASSPTTGQYSVNTGTGVYTFAAADTGITMFIDFQYTQAVSGSTKLAVNNQPMGQVPLFQAEMSMPYLGKELTIKVFNAVPTKLSFATKLDDFAVPDFEFSGFSDSAGHVLSLSTSE